MAQAEAPFIGEPSSMAVAATEGPGIVSSSLQGHLVGEKMHYSYSILHKQHLTSNFSYIFYITHVIDQSGDAGTGSMTYQGRIEKVDLLFLHVSKPLENAPI